MMFTDITVKEIFLPFLVIIGSAFALLVFFVAEGQKACWCKCAACSRWFDRRGTTTEKRPFIARFGPQPGGLCPNCAKAEQGVLKENESLSLAE